MATAVSNPLLNTLDLLRIIMWQELLVAIALVLVIEGLLPTISPDGYKKALSTFMQMDSKHVRVWGLFSMVLGTIILYIVKN